jgi:hypothetical protein
LIVANTGLRHQLLGWLYEDFSGRVVIGRAEASWTRPLALFDVSIQDKTGSSLLEFKELRTSHSIFQFARQQKTLGKFELHQPHLRIVARPGGSNVEDVLAALFPPGEGAGEIPNFELQIHDGLLTLADATTGTSFDVGSVRVATTMNNGLATIAAKAVSSMSNGHQGQLEIDGTWSPHPQHSISQAPLVLRGTQLPIGLFEPLLARYGMRGQLQGSCDLECTVRAEVTQESSVQHIVAAVSGQQLDLRIPQILGEDNLKLPIASLQCELAIDATALHLSRFELNSDILQLQARGDLPHANLASGDWRQLWTDPNPQLTFVLDSQFDAAKLASLLPNLTLLRDDVSIDQGHATIRLESQPGEHVRQLTIDLTTDQLVANARGNVIRWNEPIAVKAVIVTENGITSIEHVHASSDFLEVDGSGVAQSGTATITADLSQLTEKVTQLLDLPIESMAGKLQGQCEWGSDAANFIRAKTDLRIEQFSIATKDGIRWSEPQLAVSASGNAMLNHGRIARLDQLLADIELGTDRASFTLAAPTMLPNGFSAAMRDPQFRFPFDVKLHGALAAWLARLRPVLDLGDGMIEAEVQATADAELSPHSIWLAQSKFDLQNVNVNGWGMRFEEPTARIQTKLLWQADSGKTSLPEITLTSTTVAARGANIVIAPDTNHRYHTQGDIVIHGDLMRVSQWFPAFYSPTSRVRGEFEIRAGITSRDSSLVLDGTMTARPFALEKLPTTINVSLPPTAWRTVWSDQQVQLIAGVAYDWNNDQADFEKLYVVAEGLRASAAGSLANLTGQPTARIQGQLEYDLQTIMAKLYSFVGPGILLRGKQTQPFRIDGPLTASSFHMGTASPSASGTLALRPTPTATPAPSPRVSPELTGEATFGWEVAKIYGVTLNSSEMKAKLHDGVIDISPVQVPIGGAGYVQLAPRVELNGPEPLVVLPPTRLADNLQITPEMCSSWLRYVAPLLANATAADGQFSMDLAGASLPLSRPSAGNCSGTLSIHQARLRPGPMADQIVGIVNQLGTITGNGPQLNFLRSDNTLVEIADQQVDFRMVDGRVFHQQLEIRADDVTIRTTGWVGLDQSVSLVAEIPVQDKWVASSRWLAGLQGQSLRIPVHGSLSQPVLDMTAMRQSTQQMIGGAAEQMLRGELQRGLQGGLNRLLENR